MEQLKLEYGSLNQQLLEQLPVLREHRYTQLIGGIEAGPYVVFGVLFNQYLVDLTLGTDLQAKAVVAAFIEDMAVARDERVSEMLTTEVLPTLLRNQVMVDAYWPLLGTETRRRLKLMSPRFSVKVVLPSSE
jgi:hypothetical protein